MKQIPLFIVLMMFSNIVFSQTTPQEMVNSMGRGINLGNVLSAPFEGNWSTPVEESYFDDIVASGFQNVRIPIRFDMQTTAFEDVVYIDGGNNYIGSSDDYTVSPNYLDRVEEVIDWALSKGLVAIIDVHGDHWFWESYDSGSVYYRTGPDRLAAEDRFRAIWRDISERFQSKSDNLLFEIMNEAYFSMSAPEVNFINQEILDLIRLTNPTRNVIVNGGGVNSWEAPLQLPSSFIESDDYLIATFHYYKPFNFTSSGREQWTDNDWGTSSDKATVDSHFNAVYNWSLTNNIPVFFGEFGADNVCGYDYENETCGNFGGPDEASRFEYHHYLAEAALNRGFSFAVWDAGFKSNKTIYRADQRKWVVDIRNAVLGIDCFDSGIISNANVECGYDVDWDLFVQEPTEATYADASLYQSKDGKISMQVDVTATNNSFNSTILRNLITEDNSLSGQTLKISCYAKASTELQQFRLRIRADVEGNIQYMTSPDFDLASSDYQLYEFQYTVPGNITSLQLQVLCGKQIGTYYFDDFYMENQTLEVEDDKTGYFKIYPNPVLGKRAFIKEHEQINDIVLLDTYGRKIGIELNNNEIIFPHLPNGMYFFSGTTLSGKKITNKIFIKN